jgi:hypothetical protein
MKSGPGSNTYQPKGAPYRCKQERALILSFPAKRGRINGNPVFCLSVTSGSDVDRGRPSSWSGAIDNTAFGPENNSKLIIVSAGNTQPDDWSDYPASNITRSVHNPGQAWNALTVGAYTQKAIVSNPEYIDYKPLAPPDGLSPFSSTSFIWDRKKWPVKPDVLFEGGNILVAPDGQLIEAHEDLSLLSTAKSPFYKHFDVINATSAAAAQATYMAAKIQYHYPDAWPETIRALIINSADWTEELFSQFNLNPNSKRDVKDMLRIAGYGVPSLQKAIYTTDQNITLIAQETIQPFDKVDGKYMTKEMHFFRLPWPEEELMANPDAPVKLKITLSYFIEPGPGEIGWKDKYRYRSHGLCFDMNSETETEDMFVKRINVAAREESETVEGESDSGRWLIGMNGRKSGSVHSDIWEGTAAQLSTCNLLAVYPIIGWWRQRTHLHKYASNARYSLIVSLETPMREIDLYTPVINKIQTEIQIQTS